MSQIPNHIIELINIFIEKLEKSNIHIEEAILYGSYAKGNYDEWSDIDLALVSDNFSGIRFNDWDLLRDAKLSTSFDLSPLPFRPEDFTSDDLFVKEIKKTGIRII